MAKMNDDLFEDVPYTESKVDDSLFEDTTHPEVERSLASEVDQTPQPDVSAGRSFLVGAGQGATFNFADEITAPFAAAAYDPKSALQTFKGYMKEVLPFMEPSEEEMAATVKTSDQMQQYLDIARKEQQAAQEQHPVAYTGGAVAGGLAIPMGAVGRTGQAIKSIANPATRIAAGVALGTTTGAGMGGLAGLGEGEGSLEERLPQAIESAKTGAYIGGAIPLAGAGVQGTKYLAKEVAELPMIKRGLELFQRGVKGEKLYTEGGLKQAEQALYSQSEKLFNKIQDVKKEIGQKITARIKEADEAGVTVDLSDEVNDAFKKLDALEKTHPGTETTSYINSIKSELRQLFNIQSADDSFMGVSSKDLPEGLVLPSKPKPSYEVTPSKAREVKQSVFKYTPKYFESKNKVIEPTIAKPLEVGQDVYSGTAQKLESALENTVEGLGDNQKYGLIKDTLKRLVKREQQFEEVDIEKINDMLLKLENTGSGKNRRLFEWTMNQLEEIDPKIKKQFETEILDAAERYKLAKDIQSGGTFSGILGTKRSLGGTASNIAGLVAGKTGLAGVGKAASSFTGAVLKSKPVQKATLMAPESIVVGTTSKEPYILQRQVASAAENADPELLQNQSQQIRQKYGKEGEQLAQILENMAKENKNARRALMFTVLQNPVYRKMLGLSNEQEK